MDTTEFININAKKAINALDEDELLDAYKKFVEDITPLIRTHFKAPTKPEIELAKVLTDKGIISQEYYETFTKIF